MTDRGTGACVARLTGCWRRLFRRDTGPAGRVPAVPIEQSVTPNFLICLETGSRQVLLARHLRQTLQMSPQQYRHRWGLPPEYPMVAASYGDRRNSVQFLPPARKHGLWRAFVAMCQELKLPVDEKGALLSAGCGRGRKEKNG